jgi:hypothetical protein
LLAVVVLAPGCSDVELERDGRVRFLAPPEGARVELPLVMRWSVEPEHFRATGFDGSRSGRRGLFAVFVDSAPMRPGQHLDSLADRDRTCRASPGCPDRAWLTEHGIYLATRPELVLRGVPTGSGRRVPGGRRHQATLVLLDGRGVRTGEGAWIRSFVAPKGPG